MSAPVTIDPTVDWGLTGQAISYAVYDETDAAVVARTSSGVEEHPSGSGQYHVLNGFTVDALKRLSIVWDDGTNYLKSSLDEPISAAIARERILVAFPTTTVASNIAAISNTSIQAAATAAVVALEPLTANATRINGSATAAATLASTQPTITTCHTAGGTQSAIVLQNDFSFPTPSGLSAAWRAIYFNEVLNVLTYDAGTLTVTVDGAFTTPVEGGQDIQFFQVVAAWTRNQDLEVKIT